MRRTGKVTYFTEGALKNAHKLRREMTDVEKKLWFYLRRKNVQAVRFRKQVPIGRYIADFLSYDPKLIIELDGGQHADKGLYDATRDRWLQQQGFYVLRFWNHDVIENLDGVLENIQTKIYELQKQSG